MIIEEKDFRLIPSCNNASDFWDVELLVSIKPKGINAVARQEFKNVAYGCPITSAIKIVINYRILHNHAKDNITLVQYLKEYITQIKELKKLLLDTTTQPDLLD